MRVIAGSRKGREIEAPKGLHTRPTLAKVKEAVFGMIQFDVPGACVLDLFAGSGGLGIEALSRGAEHAVFCDSDRNAVSVIRKNLKKLSLEDAASVYPGDSLAFIKSYAGRPFGVVLLDPPYDSGLESDALRLMDECGVLEDGAIVICEHSSSNPPVFTDNYSARPARRYGDCFITYAVWSNKEQQ